MFKLVCSMFVFSLFLVPIKQLVAQAGIAAGVSILDEGDDKIRPAGRLSLDWSQWQQTTINSYGREMGPHIQRGYVMAHTWRKDVSGAFKGMKAGIGPTILVDQTVYDPKNPSSSPREKSSTKHAINVGGLIQISYQIQSKNVFMRGFWDSHLYLAGEAGILLVTARRQFVGVEVGVLL